MNIKNIKNHHSYTIRIIKLVIWFFIISGIFSYYQYIQFTQKPISSPEKIIQIHQGDNFQNIGEKLGFKSIYYKLYIKNNIPDFELQEGQYQLPETGNITEIIEALKHPIIPEQINITILEGWNIFDIDECLSEPKKTIIIKNGREVSGCLYKTENGMKKYLKTPLINKGEYINYVENPEKISALTEFFPFLKGSITLEGYLYPDTYTIDSSNFKINVFVIRQLETFETKVYNNLFKNTDISIENFQSVINLASIVEKEEKNSQYKKTVAGILKKRLQAGWMIGADITVCYPYRLTANECKMVVSKYIRDKNEYNTRTMTGLPKTPIGNPSYHTIEATLNHKESPYWYYLHNVASGKIYYATTNAEHEANKKYMY